MNMSFAESLKTAQNYKKEMQKIQMLEYQNGLLKQENEALKTQLLEKTDDNVVRSTLALNFETKKMFENLIETVNHYKSEYENILLEMDDMRKTYKEQVDKLIEEIKEG